MSELLLNFINSSLIAPHNPVNPHSRRLVGSAGQIFRIRLRKEPDGLPDNERPQAALGGIAPRWQANARLLACGKTLPMPGTRNMLVEQAHDPGASGWGEAIRKIPVKELRHG